MIEYFFIASALLVTLRLVKGPTFADRMLSADAIVNILVLYMVYYSITTNPAFVDIAIAFVLLSFLGTLAITKYVVKT